MKIILLHLFFLLSVICYAQTNFSGHYGYTESRKDFIKRNPEASKDESGYENDLVVLRLNDNQYKFWLYIIKGYRGYNSGHTEGIIKAISDSAVYMEKDTLSFSTCTLIFHFYRDKIFIDHSAGNCGFGGNITAQGNYPKNNSKIPRIRDIISTYQFNIEEYKVTSEKAIIYKTAGISEPTKQYFIKHDKVYSFYEENSFVYIQFITKNGKYIEGWIKKSDLNL